LKVQTIDGGHSDAIAKRLTGLATGAGLNFLQPLRSALFPFYGL
jgi:hypothetical protein